MAKRPFRPDAGGSSQIKGTADATVEFIPEIDKKPKIEKGTCDTCLNNRYHVSTKNGVKGLCEIGNFLRGSTAVPPENTCDHWEPRKK